MHTPTSRHRNKKGRRRAIKKKKGRETKTCILPPAVSPSHLLRLVVAFLSRPARAPVTTLHHHPSSPLPSPPLPPLPRLPPIVCHHARKPARGLDRHMQPVPPCPAPVTTTQRRRIKFYETSPSRVTPASPASPGRPITLWNLDRRPLGIRPKKQFSLPGPLGPDHRHLRCQAVHTVP